MSQKLMKDIFINTHKDQVLDYDLRLHKKEIEYGQLMGKQTEYVLELNVVFENEYGKFKLSVPEMRLNIDTDKVPVINEPWGGIDEAPTISLGGTAFAMKKNNDINSYWTSETLEVYRKKMTLEEVERKLGYAIEIVDEEEV